VRALVDECPLYDLEPAAPGEQLYPAPPRRLRERASPREALLELLASPNVASRRPLFESYDAIVQSRTVRRPEQADAAVLRLPGGGALAVSIDGNGRRVAADPYRGTIEAVLECAANLACVGAEPLGTTNNLNFANPEKPHVAWQLSESVRGLGDACRALDAPIVGGNVSLYNETPAGPIYPTPVIGMVGRLPDASMAGRLGFARAGDRIALVGPYAPALAASELAKLGGEPLPGELPAAELSEIRAAQAAVREAVRSGAARSAHDVAEGGLAVALAECCLQGEIGARVTLSQELARACGADDSLALLFGEGPGAFLLSGEERELAALEASRVPVRLIGEVGGEALEIAILDADRDRLEIARPGEGGGAPVLSLTLAELAHAHRALERLFA
jgi:phosphoribosylformylglycinamidine synthase subunit PurL